MLRLAPGSRILMAVKLVNMRRSFDGLCATITEALGGDPLSGDVFLFRGKRADRIKAIASDRTGLAIWYKRLEKDKYKWPTRDAASIELTEYELALLLDGVDFTRTPVANVFFARAATMSAANICCAGFRSPMCLIKYAGGNRCKLSHRREDAALYAR